MYKQKQCVFDIHCVLSMGKSLLRCVCNVGRLDVEAVALAGHSYGGATVTALCSQEPAFKCTAALDPWWSVASKPLPLSPAPLSGQS